MTVTQLDREALLKSAEQIEQEKDKPVIYTAGPSLNHETELGPVLEQIYEKFYNQADFVDPTSLHQGGGESGDLVDVDSDKFWNSDGTFNERRWQREWVQKKDDSFILDVIRGDVDDAFGFSGYAERFLDVAMNSFDELIDIDPLMFDLNFGLDFSGIPLFDLEFDPIDTNMLGGMVEFVKQMIFKHLGMVADAVLVARKAGHNMVGAAMEVKEAKENDIPVAVYDHSDNEDANPLPSMLDQHADYVTNKPEWAASWLIDEAKRRKQGNIERIEHDTLYDYESSSTK